LKSLDYSKNLLIIKFLVPRVDSSFYRVLAALNTALAECSDYHLKLELATRRDWKNMEEGK